MPLTNASPTEAAETARQLTHNQPNIFEIRRRDPAEVSSIARLIDAATKQVQYLCECWGIDGLLSDWPSEMQAAIADGWLANCKILVTVINVVAVPHQISILVEVGSKCSRVWLALQWIYLVSFFGFLIVRRWMRRQILGWLVFAELGSLRIATLMVDKAWRDFRGGNKVHASLIACSLLPMYLVCCFPSIQAFERLSARLVLMTLKSIVFLLCLAAWSSSTQPLNDSLGELFEGFDFLFFIFVNCAMYTALLIGSKVVLRKVLR